MKKLTIILFLATLYSCSKEVVKPKEEETTKAYFYIQEVKENGTVINSPIYIK
jgi:hypothetical protein